MIALLDKHGERQPLSRSESISAAGAAEAGAAVVRGSATRWSMKDGVRGGLALLDQGISSATSFITMVVVARCCTESELGVYALVMTFVVLMRSAQDRLLAAPYLVFSHRRTGHGRDTLLGSSLVHQALFCLSAMALTVMICGLVWGGWIRPPTLLASCLALVGAVSFILLRDHLRAVSFAQFHLATALLIDVVVCVFQLGGLAVLYATGNLSPATVFAATGAACAVAGGVWWFACPVPIAVASAEIRSDWRQNWNYARWLVIARSFGTASRFLMPWIVLTALDEVAAGVLGTCVSLVGLSFMFTTGINNFLLPRSVRAFCDGGVPSLARTLLETGALFTLFLGTLCVVYALAGDRLLSLIYGAKFGSYGAVVAVLGLNVLVTSWAIVAANGLAALGKPKGNLWGEISTLVVTLGVALWAVHEWGLMGVAAAMLVGNVSGALVTGVVLVRLMLDPASVPHSSKGGVG